MASYKSNFEGYTATCLIPEPPHPSSISRLSIAGWIGAHNRASRFSDKQHHQVSINLLKNLNMSSAIQKNMIKTRQCIYQMVFPLIETLFLILEWNKLFACCQASSNDLKCGSWNTWKRTEFIRFLSRNGHTYRRLWGYNKLEASYTLSRSSDVLSSDRIQSSWSQLWYTKSDDV